MSNLIPKKKWCNYTTRLNSSTIYKLRVSSAKHKKKIYEYLDEAIDAYDDILELESAQSADRGKYVLTRE